MALRVLGPHPKDKQPVELHAGRFGPYVKHGDVNATLPEQDQADALTLDDAVQLLAAKAAREGGASFASTRGRVAARAAAAKTTPVRAAAKTAAKTAAKSAPKVTPATKRASAAKPAARKPVVRKPASKRKS